MGLLQWTIVQKRINKIQIYQIRAKKPGQQQVDQHDTRANNTRTNKPDQRG